MVKEGSNTRYSGRISAPRCSSLSHLHTGILLSILISMVAVISVSEACDHHKEVLTYKPLNAAELLSKRRVAVNDRKSQEESLKFLHNYMAKRNEAQNAVQVRPLDGNSDVDSMWMKAALSAVMECYGPCPSIPYGSVLVHKPTSKLVMHACNTAYLDATNHAEMNTIQLAAHYYPNKTQEWWNSLTLYTTAEPCAMCMTAARWTGIGEIVYATSISTQSSYGWGSIKVSAQTINEASYELPTRSTLQGPFGTSITNPYFAWQFNASAPCPPGCIRQTSPAICIPQ